MPFRAPPIPLGQMDARQQATYFAQQGIQATGGAVRTFTPTSWDDFSVDPSGEISYIDFGAYVMMWADSALTGTSDGTDFQLDGVPTNLLPTVDRRVASFGMVNNATGAAGEADVFGKDSVFAGRIQFAILRTDSVANFAVPVYSIGWTNLGVKGLVSGWVILYPR